MKLSRKNVLALMLDIHQDIDEHADWTVQNIIEKKKFDFLNYPPNGGLTDSERTALGKLVTNEDLKNALRKLLANHSGGVIFNIMSLLDNVTDARNNESDWTGIKLVDQTENRNPADEYHDMLHDKFFETYWDWKEIRGEKGWKLDIYED